MDFTKPYNRENMDKAIANLEKVLVNQDKLKSKYTELLTTLIRHRRAHESTFWLNINNYKKLSTKEKHEMIRKERCVHVPSSGSMFQDMKEFPYFAKRQWIKDRDLLIKEGKIIVQR